MKNEELRSLYDRVYNQGAEKFFTFSGTEEMFGIIEAGMGEWDGKRVLEIGCGEGRLAAILAMCEARVLAIDFSSSAIEIAKQNFRLPNLEFRCCDYTKIEGKFDVIVMQGVLEHIDDPLDALETMAEGFLNRPGRIISSSPSFLNPRGYIWMALLKLFNVPMSLSDIHYFCPFDYEELARKLGAELHYQSIDQDWGHGERLLVDYNKRLRNALRDRGLEGDVDGFLKWLAKTIKYAAYTDFSGANIVYTLSFAKEGFVVHPQDTFEGEAC